jgi:hypothetical protein
MSREQVPTGYFFIGQSSWLLTQRAWVRFLEPPNFLRTSGPAMGSTEPRKDKSGKKFSGSRLEN